MAGGNEMTAKKKVVNSHDRSFPHSLLSMVAFEREKCLVFFWGFFLFGSSILDSGESSLHKKNQRIAKYNPYIIYIYMPPAPRPTFCVLDMSLNALSSFLSSQIL